MKSRGWAVLGGLVVLIALLSLLRGPAGAGDSPEHRADSDAANGTSALRLYAESLGHPTGTVEGDFTLPASPALLFVFTPSQSHGFSGAEAQQVASWVTSGGILVYAAEQSEPQLDTQFGLRRSAARAAANGAASQTASAPGPIFGGVKQVSGGDPAQRLVPSPAQVPLFRNRLNEVVALRTAIGQGMVVALTDPLFLCNGYLGQPDNGRFAADLFALVPPGGRVLFDEFHHGAVAAASPEIAWMMTPWGAALVWAVIVLFAGIALRARAFGPRLSLGSTRDRSSAEYAEAIGRLLHRTGARAVTLETLVQATRRAVADRIGVGTAVPAEAFRDVVARRAPAVGAQLMELERNLPQAAASEASVLDTARRLHDLAYPLASNVSGKEPG
ncbi:MAG: DUF4350 domain-containing protein [Candidatus Dormibacteraeota bacterium]|nr:DUF4350 domain-containing protein [Candidatus Dormibacteraeota bacterium]